MTPKKRTAPSPAASSRATRGSARRAKHGSPAPSSAGLPPEAKKQKMSHAGSGKKPKAAPSKAAPSKAAPSKAAPKPSSLSKTVVIEHCKQCNSFKTRALQVKAGLENGVSGITVLVNPDKPRMGCFEIREESGEKFISLLDMKRPFTKMKELDMEKVISDTIAKLK